MKETLALFLCFFWLFLPQQALSQEENARDLFSRGYALFSQGNLNEAEGLFRKTLNQKFALEDYSLYFLGRISFVQRDLAGSRHYLLRLKQDFSQSVWSPRTDLELAKVSLAGKNYQEAARQLRALLGQTAKREISDEALYLLGQIYDEQGEWKQAHSTYQELRRMSPLSAWAGQARKEVNRLRKKYPKDLALGRADSLAEEGELLLREREHQEAEKIYRQLLDLIPQGPLRPRFLFGLANVYQAARKREEALPVLAKILREYPSSLEAPNALYRLAMIHWNRDDNLKALDSFGQLQERYRQSAFSDSAQFASARIYESLGRTDEARLIYADFSKKFPSSRMREEATWRLAWVHYLRADYKSAYSVFKELAKDKAGERYKNAALYWQARSAERMGQSEEAQETLKQIINGQEESYYWGLAARALETMGGVAEAGKTASVTALPEMVSVVTSDLSFHLSRAQILTELSLHPLAIAELDAIRNGADLPMKVMLMREYARNQAYNRSVAVANQIYTLSDELSRYRYPLGYWETIHKLATESDVDPYLVVALIRQESLFDPKALSPASAFGLMQLLPATAVRTAKQLELPSPKPGDLFEPDLNLRLGIHHLKELLQRYSNNLVKAIAAYNAGENAVNRWQEQILTQDEEEFIERIPYAETRLYVKLVLRNHRIYRKIYPGPKNEPRER